MAGLSCPPVRWCTDGSAWGWPAGNSLCSESSSMAHDTADTGLPHVHPCLGRRDPDVWRGDAPGTRQTALRWRAHGARSPRRACTGELWSGDWTGGVGALCVVAGDCTPLPPTPAPLPELYGAVLKTAVQPAARCGCGSEKATASHLKREQGGGGRPAVNVAEG